MEESADKKAVEEEADLSREITMISKAEEEIDMPSSRKAEDGGAALQQAGEDAAARIQLCRAKQDVQIRCADKALFAALAQVI